MVAVKRVLVRPGTYENLIFYEKTNLEKKRTTVVVCNLVNCQFRFGIPVWVKKDEDRRLSLIFWVKNVFSVGLS